MDQRLEVLEGFCKYGPDYNRNVAVAVSDHLLFAQRGDTKAAEHFLLLAEMRAGLMTWDEYESRDPFRPAQQTLAVK